MSDALHIIAIWTHILGIALWVGPQFFLAFAWVPASRQIADPLSRLEAMRTITRRFAYIGGIGLLLILVAGLYLVTDFRSYYHYDGGFFDIRFGVIFLTKMITLAVMLSVIGFHTFIVGPRLLALMEARIQGKYVSDAAIRKARLQSMTFSILGLLLTLCIMSMGAMLNTVTFSLR
jgi:uncharacterized membrane protein